MKILFVTFGEDVMFYYANWIERIIYKYIGYRKISLINKISYEPEKYYFKSDDFFYF